ncbi:DUF2339 domain-containing protein [Undibacterium sp. Ren11W]|uniref:DUF2339 domain-containing protein n=1 Tax=Undibacterium sp. Ren11W TaxID=3413045 RepID=UPI003BF1AC68
MWFLGVILGLMIGAGFQSFPGAFFMAIIGGVVVHQLSKSKRDRGSQVLPLGESDSVQNLRQKLALMEARLSSVERQLAQRVVAGVEPLAARPEINEPIQPPVAAPNEAEVSASQPQSRPDLVAPVFVMAAAKTPDPVLAMPAQKAPEILPEVIKVAPAKVAAPAAPLVRPRPAAKPAEPIIPFKERLPAPIRNFIYGGNTLVKMGVLILFLGLAFLLRYTAERVTVPIELRYAGVALTGVALLGLGWFLRLRRTDYALIMQGMGVGVFYLTTLSAIKFHALIPSEMGFVFMFVVSLLGAVLAILQKAPSLAIIAALEGFATPILTATGGNHMLGLFTYLSILDLGIVLVAWFNAWRILNVIGFVGTFTLASGWANQYYSDAQYAPVQAFLILFFLLFTATGVFFARRTLLDAKSKLDNTGGLAQQAAAALTQVGRVDSALVFGTPLTAFGLQYILSKQWEFGPAFSAMALAAFYFILARLIFSRERKGMALLAEAYAIVGVIFATLAIPLGLEGVWTSAAWAVEGAGMYWLGVRQHRPYARAFAYLVLVGASYKLLHAIGINAAPAAALLQGSSIGPLLLVLSAFAMWTQHRGGKLDSAISPEYLPGKCLPWLGIAALTILPWQWFSPAMAAAASALLSVITYFVARRRDLKALQPIVLSLQALAVGSFIFTLHSAPAAADEMAKAAGAVLESGLQGMLAAFVIAASILLTAGWSMAQARKTALANGLPPAWSRINSISVVVGTALLHLALLFAVSLQQAIVIWPITSYLVLWVALRMSHIALAGLAAALQLISVVLFVFKPDLFEMDHMSAIGAQLPLVNLAPFAHLHFFAPLTFAVVAWLSGDSIRAEAKRLLASLLEKNESDYTTLVKPVRWFNPWCTQTIALYLPVFWGLFWWLSAWGIESSRVLELRLIPEYFGSAMGAIVLLTSLLVSAIARWRDWRQMGVASMFTLPALLICSYLGLAGSGLPFLPSAYLGWVLWPLALIWHFCLLHMQARWCAQEQRNTLHVFGFWFYLFLAARECQARFGFLGESTSSWPLLGWVLVPALSFWLLRSSWLAKRWPLTEFRRGYLETACTPVAVYLLAWCFLSNILSAGDAAPLPYLPLLNPLELGQWLVLAALLLWWRALPEQSGVRLRPDKLQAISAVLGLALITGMVLRSCHHFAGVAWHSSALFSSHLTQAALSITWASLGVLSMLFGNRRGSRTVWAGGAALLAVVVLKLFVVELADRGGLYQIVSFIGVGVLLLVVGYFAPVPLKVDAAALRKQDSESLESI